MDETVARIAGRWMYLFRAVDSHGETVDFYLSETRDREAVKIFLKEALANLDNRAPQVFSRDGLLSYRRFENCRPEDMFDRVAVSSRGATVTIGSNPIIATSSAG